MPTASISRESRCANPDNNPQPLDQDAKTEKTIQRQQGPRTRATSCRNAGRLHPGIAGRHPRNPQTETGASGGIGLGRGGRLSRQRKRDAVLRLLRGEDLETLSRALGVTAATLIGWQDSFLAAGEASLATRPPNGEALESERLKAKLGEMLLERELLEAKIAALEANRPLARRRLRP